MRFCWSHPPSGADVLVGTQRRRARLATFSAAPIVVHLGGGAPPRRCRGAVVLDSDADTARGQSTTPEAQDGVQGGRRACRARRGGVSSLRRGKRAGATPNGSWPGPPITE
jgi:hypothetical protein